MCEQNTTCGRKRVQAAQIRVLGPCPALSCPALPCPAQPWSPVSAFQNLIDKNISPHSKCLSKTIEFFYTNYFSPLLDSNEKQSLSYHYRTAALPHCCCGCSRHAARLQCFAVPCSALQTAGPRPPAPPVLQSGRAAKR